MHKYFVHCIGFVTYMIFFLIIHNIWKKRYTDLISIFKNKLSFYFLFLKPPLPLNPARYVHIVEIYV